MHIHTTVNQLNIKLKLLQILLFYKPFLAHGGNPDTVILLKVSTQRENRPLLYKLASLLHRSVSFIRFAYGAWTSSGRGVVSMSRIPSNHENFFWSVWRHFLEIVHRQKFHTIQYFSLVLVHQIRKAYNRPWLWTNLCIDVAVVDIITFSFPIQCELVHLPVLRRYVRYPCCSVIQHCKEF